MNIIETEVVANPILESANNKCDMSSEDNKQAEDVLMVTKTEVLQPPGPAGEEIIIDSYDVPCPDETIFIWPQEIKFENKLEN